MTIFAEKLATLVDTVRLGADGPIGTLAECLGDSAGRTVIAIGSGGSAIMAEYLARCRSTLGHGLTIIQTPMDFVVMADYVGDHDVWIFSAGADNPDAVAAMATALGSSARGVKLLTVNAWGAIATTARSDDRCSLIVAPVSDRKDGFLATHSLIAMATCLLAASDLIAMRCGSTDAVERLAVEVERIAASPADIDMRSGDTVVVLHDPQCSTIATLLETSLWETAIAPVQRADFRNFAHGRHVWAARHPDNMLVIAIITSMSRGIWSAIRTALPASIRLFEIDLGHAGRYMSAASIAHGLEIVRALGEKTGIDPGKPGRGEFAGAIYDDPGLADLARKLQPAVRHKLSAVQLHDDPTCPQTCATAARDAWIAAMSRSPIGAILLDYDGTLVTTEARLEPPSRELVAELTRLADGGLALGFATGRGGSAGVALRDALPQRLHPRVTMGYYNGGHLRSLEVDIESDRPPTDPDLASLADWIEAGDMLARGVKLKRGEVQLTVRHSELTDPKAFVAAVGAFPAVTAGRLKMLSSHHSFDILPAATSKTAVTVHMQSAIGEARRVLAIGDSGEPGGNDSELLDRPPSISVDGVCGHLDGSWSIFGRSATGPDALLRILRALRLETGHARLDIDSLSVSFA